MEKFEQFIKERIYLKNVSPRTLEWHRACFKWLGRFPITEDGPKNFVIGMRQAGLQPVSCNGRIAETFAALPGRGVAQPVQKDLKPWTSRDAQGTIERSCPAPPPQWP